MRRALSIAAIAFCLLVPGILGFTPVHRGASAEEAAEEIVSFNTKSLKYHCRTCEWANKCTVNCVNIAISEAIRRGGIACKVCRGTCRR